MKIKLSKSQWENIGRTATVLFENDVENGLMHGFTQNYIRVVAQYDPLLINELKHVKLCSINEKGLVEVEETEIFVHH